MKINFIQKNKKGWILRDWMITLVLISGVLALWFVSTADFSTNYEETRIIDESFMGKYNQFSNVTESINDMQEEMTDKEGLSLVAATTVGIFRSTWNIILSVFESTKNVQTQTTNFGSDYGIPKPIASLIFPLLLAIITIIIIFVIASSINRGNKL